MNTQTWLMRPNSPLVLRTGRPFGAVGASGAADSYDFPLPATTAGAFRAAWCDAAQHEHQPNDRLLAGLRLRGPLRCTATGHQASLWLPQPADALVVCEPAQRKRIWVHRLGPALRGANTEADAGGAAAAAGCDLPYGLQPVSTPEDLGGGEAVEGPPWWSRVQLESWLGQDTIRYALGAMRTAAALPKDRRVNVAIDPRSLGALDEALFATTGIDFTQAAGEAAREGADAGLLMWLDGQQAEHAEGLARLAHRHGRLGADGRTATFVTLQAADDLLPNCSSTLQASLGQVQVGDVLRLYLATPACYLYNGWYPDGLKPCPGANEKQPCIEGSLEGLPGWRFRLVAAALGRHLAHAGSAMRDSNNLRVFQPRPLRRLVPAGSVYWLQVLERDDSAGPLAARWWQPTCRVEYGRDGHGLGLWGHA